VLYLLALPDTSSTRFSLGGRLHFAAAPTALIQPGTLSADFRHSPVSRTIRTSLQNLDVNRAFIASAEELCADLHGIGLLVLNTEGSGMDTPALVRSIRKLHRGLPVLHVGKARIPGMPSDVQHRPESFTADQLLETVSALVPGQRVPQR
jgi:hypothetical protein